ncbi:MAG: hypothetical protein GVY08_12200 [Bacteroidetes bacterium]|jgi:hypothetical protein|nr:hypothetical protein [Bacteroidota bacterium]
MSKQEIYAWTSLLSSVAILGFYGITVYGLPDTLAGIESDLSSLFIKIFLFAFVIELAIGIFRGNDKVEKDERDELIAGRGYRNGYYLMGALITIILSQLVLGQIFGEAGLPLTLVNVIHVLVGTLFAASITNRATQIYFYQKI